VCVIPVNERGEKREEKKFKREEGKKEINNMPINSQNYLDPNTPPSENKCTFAYFLRTYTAFMQIR